MRALLCRSLEEGIDGLRVEDVPPPGLSPDGVRIEVHAAAMNFADTLLVRGRYQEKPALPFAPGLEVAGFVLEVAPGVQHVLPGERVVALLDHGGFAEEAVARASEVVRIPEEIDDATAAAIPIAYLTSYLALVERARLQPREVLVVFGASGGVGLSAVEVGHGLGARVIAVASSHDKLATALDRGADDAVSYTEEDVAARIEELAGGADVIYDPVGGELFEAGLHAINPGGRILLVGFASGTVPQIPANHLLVKDAAALGFSIGQFRRHQPDRVRAALAELLRMTVEGRLRPLVSQVLPLDRAVEGLRELQVGRTVGKLVVRPR
ncbi:MAG: NADPH:quinone oxidoreductase family protein [Dehalococcoidia bacterium]|nr:NADPH:quinone oxidoreductase family protein [Dehalococcoidia bacterium]